MRLIKKWRGISNNGCRIEVLLMPKSIMLIYISFLYDTEQMCSVDEAIELLDTIDNIYMGFNSMPSYSAIKAVEFIKRWRNSA